MGHGKKPGLLSRLFGMGGEHGNRRGEGHDSDEHGYPRRGDEHGDQRGFRGGGEHEDKRGSSHGGERRGGGHH